MDPFFLGFRSSLGASWEPSWASWGSLGKPQERKNADSPTRKPLFWKCSFVGLWSSWWPSWAHLAPSLADLVRKWAPKWSPKVVQKVTKKWFKKWSQKWPTSAKFVTHFGSPDSPFKPFRSNPTTLLTKTIKNLWFFSTFRPKSVWPKVFRALFHLIRRCSQDGFKIVQDSPKTVPKWSQNGSRLDQIAQDSPKNGPR